MLRLQPESLRQRGIVHIVEMPRLRLFSGVAEGIARLALIIPAAIGVVRWLLGPVVLMLGAIFFHRLRVEQI
jgi:hypothetical protein